MDAQKHRVCWGNDDDNGDDDPAGRVLEDGGGLWTLAMQSRMG